ncbi:mitochondrial-processing peptidase subunit alpha-like [Actinidia eriantha]|uniref:mitochondrial-processing peptidase subunit alpha-like n=1 Tax=Actinidia eriantha TaxID=165200 RepID=UPI002587F66F|nr:mitochondrial-processing peptidase subunit alpha-like [Actinidia eriantha]XP_057501066.1 mitochondrial-processing peptidase subunit alpha-like [Actinidia eriantha]XP_057501067.1 mitochondrial-processing peptidase subunit alpha-like [Actinidia eriantha]
MVELLIDCVRNPAFLDWVINDQLLKVKAEIAEPLTIPQALLLEAIHSAGYSGVLVNPLLALEYRVSRLNSTILEEFVAARNFTAPRMVLAASSVEHEELLKIAEPLLSDLPGIRHPQENLFISEVINSGQTHFALAFEVPGDWIKEKEAMTFNFLEIGLRRRKL